MQNDLRLLHRHFCKAYQEYDNDHFIILQKISTLSTNKILEGNLLHTHNFRKFVTLIHEAKATQTTFVSTLPMQQHKFLPQTNPSEQQYPAKVPLHTIH
jgi:hypothetical protein